MSGGGAPPGRLDVGVVGAGRVGAVLGNALRAAGHAVVGASGISEETLERIATLLPGVPVLEVPDVVARADVVLLTVPDDALAGLVEGLATLGLWRPGQIVVHAAGRYGTGVLAPAADAGAIPIAIHPAMTFTGTSLDIARLAGCPMAVTAPAPVLPIAQALVLEIGGEPVVLAEQARAAYHAAVCHGANHLVTLVAQAERLLERLGVDRPGTLLAPVLSAALDGAVRGGEAGLTGPVVRGDVGTVSEHLRVVAALAAQDERLADVLPTYVALARATVQRSLVLGRLTTAQAQALLDVLDAAAPTPLLSPNAPLLGSNLPLDPARVRSRGVLGREGGGAAGGGEPPAVARTRSDLATELARLTGRRAVVMTMGALHEGHLELVRQARALADHVVVTIFVNPLQFGAGEDLDRYPRQLEADVAALASLGVELVFAPTPDVMYPDGTPVVTVAAGRLGEVWEGASRPGHFDGVLTVVAKLLHLVRPDVALFGQKDAQQLAAIRRMVRDLELPVEVVAVPIQRDADGLALSSRNVYLSAAERSAALALSRALRAAQPAADGAGPVTGASPAEAALAAARAVLDAQEHAAPGAVVVDYLTLVDPDDLAPVEADYRGTALLAVAARVGRTRLIDNTLVHLGSTPAGLHLSGGA